MKLSLALTFITLLSANASSQVNIPGTTLQERIFELNPPVIDSPTMSFSEIRQSILKLNQFIGGYPPSFTNEKERELIYRKWLVLVSEAEAFYTVHNGSEESLYLLSELYRQGHNMDVEGSAEKAFNNLSACLHTFKKSVMCNFSASYFYLSIGPAYLDKAELSLSILKEHFSPNLNSEVESGYVFLHIYHQDIPKAKQQIDFFIQKFPNSSRVAMFENIKQNLGDTIEWKQH
ncbi:hypothetical protein ACJJIW_13885 [Microbulbifer sp. JMSA004]|uniref:hypothetical protein n=1 Tax=Microbulbifer sp. JMSA004 TaxID=3243370 RepID=UPI004039652F